MLPPHKEVVALRPRCGFVLRGRRDYAVFLWVHGGKPRWVPLHLVGGMARLSLLEDRSKGGKSRQGSSLPGGRGQRSCPLKRTLSHGLCCSICYYKKLLCWVLGWASKCVLCSSERADARRGSWCCSCWLSLALTVWRSVFPGASDFNTLNFHGDRRLLRCFGFVAFRRSSVSGVGGGRTISSKWHGLLGVTVNPLDEHQLPVAGLLGEHVGQLIALRAPLCEVRQEL